MPSAPRRVSSKPEPAPLDPTIEATLSDLKGCATAHRILVNGQARTAHRHERSCAGICRAVIDASRQLTEAQRRELFRAAVHRRLLPTRSRAADDLTWLTRLAAGSHESKSVVSRIAAVARVIQKQQLNAAEVLPDQARFWAVHERLCARPGKTNDVVGVLTEVRATLVLAPAVLALLQSSGAVIIGLLWDSAAGQIVMGDVIPGSIADAPAQLPSRSAVTWNTVQAESAVATTYRDAAESMMRGQINFIEAIPVSQDTVWDGAVIVAAADEGEGAAALMSVAFNKNVKVSDKVGFDLLMRHGRFVRDERTKRSVWTGQRFAGLNALMQAHDGHDVI